MSKLKVIKFILISLKKSSFLSLPLKKNIHSYHNCFNLLKNIKLISAIYGPWFLSGWS